MICSKCGFKMSAGVTCPSCGYNETDQDPEQAARRKLNVYMPSPVKKVAKSSTSHAKSSPRCNACGFHLTAGNTCPSCGHTNSTSDPEYIARKNAKEYTYGKPKTWVVVLSVFGIIVNALLGIIYFASLLDLDIERKGGLLLALIVILQVAINILMIVSFANLIRMRRWALWVIRISYVISTILIAVNGSLLSVQFALGALLTLVFWFGDWKDYT